MDFATTLSGNEPIAITIGNFDGIHRGHQRLLDELRAHFRIQAMVVGNNFSLGHNRMGDIPFLQRYGQEHHIHVLPIELEEAERARISSTRIRSLVSEGQIIDANELLGHPVVVSGIVVKGDQRGRLLGFPTANLLPEAHKLLPMNGVYAAYVHIEHVPESDAPDQLPVSYTQNEWNSVVNIGVRPTFGGQQRMVEAHLLDVQLDLYGQRITIDL